jgi:hypothetical protein
LETFRLPRTLVHHLGPGQALCEQTTTGAGFMLIKTIHSWQIPENRATPEHVFLNRRKFIAAAGFAGIGLAAGIRPGHGSTRPVRWPVPG